MLPVHWQLGFIAGVTIFLGLPIAMMRTLDNRWRSFLNATSTGILIFLLIEILGKVLEEVEEAFEHAAAAASGSRITAFWPEGAWPGAGLLVAGVGIGLLGLVWFERTFLSNGFEATGGQRARQLAFMIALGIGLHNFGEGLAIGQEYAIGAARMALFLAAGFGLHNATEGFGIAAPLAGHRPNWGFLGLLGLVGGGPTVLGAILGGAWVSKATEIFCLSLAGGTILYVIGELRHIGRQLRNEVIAQVGLLVGFFVAFATEILIHLAH